MDEDYARSTRIPIMTDQDQRTRLRFADGSTAMTSGMTYGVEWEFGPGEGAQKHILDFHILKDAPAPVISSDEFLFGTNAFAEYECYLLDDDDEDDDDDAYFFIIDIDLSYQNNAQTKDEARYRELIRHDEELDRIADLPVSQQSAARALEEERHVLAVAQQSAIPDSSLTLLTPAAGPSPPRRQRWRLGLL